MNWIEVWTDKKDDHFKLFLKVLSCKLEILDQCCCVRDSFGEQLWEQEYIWRPIKITAGELCPVYNSTEFIGIAFQSLKFLVILYTAELQKCVHFQDRNKLAYCSGGPLWTNVRLEHYDSLSIREQSILFWPSSGEAHSYQLTCSELASIREFKKLRRLLQWKPLCVRLSILRLYHGGHVAQNKRSALSLAWHEWFSCKGRESVKDLLLQCRVVVRTSKVNISRSLRQ